MEYQINCNKNGFVSIHKQKVPIVGNICMDMLMVDLEKLPAKMVIK